MCNDYGNLIETQRRLRRGYVPARATGVVVADIDDLAFLITGDRTFFHFKAHSASHHFQRRET